MRETRPERPATPTPPRRFVRRRSIRADDRDPRPSTLRDTCHTRARVIGADSATPLRVASSACLHELPRWCVTHKWITIFAIWVPILVGVNVVATSAGSAFSTDFNFPGSESQQVIDQLESVSPEDAGFPGQIVFRYEGDQGVNNPEVKAAMEGIFAKVDAMEGVSVTSPYDNPSQISPDGTIAFAQLDITERDSTEILDFGDGDADFDDDIAIDGLTIEYGGDIFGEFELPASRAVRLHRGDDHPDPRLRLGAGDGSADRHRVVRPRPRRGVWSLCSARRCRCPTSRRRWRR